MRKLTPEELALAVDWRASGWTLADIAIALKVSRETLRKRLMEAGLHKPKEHGGVRIKSPLKEQAQIRFMSPMETLSVIVCLAYRFSVEDADEWFGFNDTESVQRWVTRGSRKLLARKTYWEASGK